MRLYIHQSKFQYNPSCNNHGMNFDKNSSKSQSNPNRIQVPLNLVFYSA